MALFLLTEDEYSKLKKKSSLVPDYIKDVALKVKSKYPDKTAKGYKRIEHILDSSYNEFNKNENGKVNNAGKVIPTSTVKKMSHDLKASGAICDPKAQAEIKSWADREVETKRNEVKANKMVPKVPKPSKTPSPKETEKSQKIGNINLRETKTIIISENQLLKLNYLLYK